MRLLKYFVTTQGSVMTKCLIMYDVSVTQKTDCFRIDYFSELVTMDTHGNHCIILTDVQIFSYQPQ